MRRFQRTWLTMAAFLAATGGAYASSVTLDQCVIAELCGQVTVTTTLVGNTIDVDVTDVAGAPVTGIFGWTGANRAFGFSVVDPDLDVAISSLTAGFSYAGAGVNGMGGGFGDFDFIVNGPQTGSAATLPLHFNVSRPTGFLSDLGVFEANDLGFVLAAHVRNNDNGVTGFVGALPPVNPPDYNEFPVESAPEPATLAMLGLGLVAVGRRMRQKAVREPGC